MSEVKVKICGQKPGTKAVCSLYKDYYQFGVKVCISETPCPDQVNAVVTVRVDQPQKSELEEKNWTQF